MQHIFPEIQKNFGFGMMRLPMAGQQVDYDLVSRMVDAFLDAGFNYFDTAHPYLQGMSEDAVRLCLAQRHPRERFVLTNKLSGGCFAEEADIRPLFEEQLHRCGVTYFDFYLHHAMSAQRHQRYIDTRAYEIVKELKAEGKIRHIGLSFHDTAQVLDKILTDRPEIEVVQLQINYVDWDDPVVQSRLCLEVCRRHRKSVIVMEPVKGGSLVNLPPRAAALIPGSQAGFALRFAAGQENVVMVLSGMSDLAQMADNLATMGAFTPLSGREMEIMEQVRTIYQGQHRIPCTACSYCTDGCPAGIPIPAVFACFNDKKQEKAGADAAFAAIENGPGACLDCGQCEQVCPQKLHIRQLLEDVGKAF